MAQQLSLFDIDTPDSQELEKDEIRQLRKELSDANRRYYVESTPTMSDREFDEKMHRLEMLEKQHPEMADAASPTQHVGSDIETTDKMVSSGKSGSGFTQITHRYPMLSLANTYSEEEIRQWLERVYKGLEGEREVEIVCELKFDGLSISLWYEDGILTHAVTRGDGVKGDDVIANIRTIAAIPSTISHPVYQNGSFELRGEVLLPWENFERLNKLREEQEEPLFANPRNAASGTLKLLDAEEVKRRGLVTYLYYVLGDNLPGNTHSERLEWARQLGFPITEQVRVCHSVEEVMEYIHYWDKERKNLPVATDGVVLKVNDLRQQQLLGYTAKTPRWAIAFKFEAEKQLTKLEKITYQVGRTGAVTPVANMTPVQLSGTMVHRATLNNEDFIRQLNLHEGDMVWVEKGGEIIPKVIASESAGNENSASYRFITHCPECGTPLVRMEGEAAWYCPNDATCPPQIKGKIEHFVARKAMNIDGLGAETIDLFYEKGMLHNVADIYDLRAEQIAPLPGFGEKSAERILQGIAQSKNVPWARVLFALGIRFVGETTAKRISRTYTHIDSLMQATEDELQHVEDVGEIVAASVVHYFQEPQNQEMVARLKEAGLQMQGEAISRPSSIGIEGILDGKSIVISGVFEHHSRDEYKELIEQLGGKNVGSISKKTSFVLAGDQMGPSKREKAEALGIPLMSESDFLELIANG